MPVQWCCQGLTPCRTCHDTAPAISELTLTWQEEDNETPMQPITVMRNALGGEHGGSGVDLDRAAYDASVEYWRDRAVVLWGEQPAGE